MREHLLIQMSSLALWIVRIADAAAGMACGESNGFAKRRRWMNEDVVLVEIRFDEIEIVLIIDSID